MVMVHLIKIAVSYEYSEYDLRHFNDSMIDIESREPISVMIRHHMTNTTAGTAHFGAGSLNNIGSRCTNMSLELEIAATRFAIVQANRHWSQMIGLVSLP